MSLVAKAAGRSPMLETTDLTGMDQALLIGIVAAVVPAANKLPLKWVLGHCTTGGPDVRATMLEAANDIDLELFARRINHNSLPQGYQNLVRILTDASKGHGSNPAVYQRRDAVLLLAQLAVLVSSERVTREQDAAAEALEAELEAQALQR